AIDFTWNKLPLPVDLFVPYTRFQYILRLIKALKLYFNFRVKLLCWHAHWHFVLARPSVKYCKVFQCLKLESLWINIFRFCMLFYVFHSILYCVKRGTDRPLF